MKNVPCAHLIERDPPQCEVGRRVPEDCRRACAAYSAGLTSQERDRAILWAEIRAHAEDDE